MDNGKPNDSRAKAGLIPTLSMADFKPDQRLIDAALAEGPMVQGGNQSDKRFEQAVPLGPMSHGTRKSPGF